MGEQWKVVLLVTNEITPKEISVGFPNEPTAKRFMSKNEPEFTFATNKAFMMALETQKAMAAMKQQ